MRGLRRRSQGPLPFVLAGGEAQNKELPLPLAASPAFAAPANMSIVGDLRSLAASHLNSLRRRLDTLHGASVRELEASHSRISKHVKMQMHLQLAKEADKEHKRMADKIAEHCKVVKLKTRFSSVPLPILPKQYVSISKNSFNTILKSGISMIIHCISNLSNKYPTAWPWVNQSAIWMICPCACSLQCSGH